MRATIRRAKYADTVTAAMARLEIDDTATYYRLTKVDRPAGQTPAITEKVLSGYQARSHISHQLVLDVEEIEQHCPDEVAVRCTSPYVMGNGGRRTSTYTKIC